MKSGGSFLSLLLVTAVFGQSVSPELLALANAERAFAKQASAEGVRASFIANFADDGIAFNPEPFKARESLSKQPEPSGPPKVTLRWSPYLGDIAYTNDLGYTTGPFMLTTNGEPSQPPKNGIYFSVWAKQPDGVWKVVLDMGTDTPSAVAPLDAPFHAADITSARTLPSGALNDADNQSAKYAIKSRKHKQRLMPLIGRDAIMSWLKTQGAVMKTKPAFSRLAKSKDVGYTYGSYEFGGETGSYARVWRAVDGEWQIVAEVTNAR